LRARNTKLFTVTGVRSANSSTTIDPFEVSIVAV
jgi:hypothetical protein